MTDFEFIKDLPPEKRENLFRLDRRISFWKWFIGTAGLALLTWISTNYFREREVSLQEARYKHERELQLKEAEQKYLSEYVSYALEDDLEKRIRFAHYFKNISIDPEMISKWQNYYDELLESKGDQSQLTAAERIGGVESILQISTGRKITQIWIGAEPNAPLDAIKSYHLSIGWADVGFHYYIDLDGKIHEGRDLSQTPAFVLRRNSGSVGIGIACDVWTDFERRPETRGSCNFSQKQIETASGLVSALLQEHDLSAANVFERSRFRGFSDLLGDDFGKIISSVTIEN